MLCETSRKFFDSSSNTVELPFGPCLLTTFYDRNQMVLKMIVTEAGRVRCVEDELDLGYDKMMMVLCLCHSVQVTSQPSQCAD